MPRINLLPTRALAKLDSARQELTAVVCGVLFALFALYLWHGVTQSRIEDSQLKSAALNQDLTGLQQKVTQIEAFKSEAALLEKKLATIDKLARSRSGPARVLDALAQVINDVPKVWLTRFAEKDGVLVLEGGAMDQEDVSAFHLGLAKQPELFTNVKLTLVNASHEQETEYLKWTISCTPIYEAS
jgi:type IV pilus assembly protein PilN